MHFDHSGRGSGFPKMKNFPDFTLGSLSSALTLRVLLTPYSICQWFTVAGSSGQGQGLVDPRMGVTIFVSVLLRTSHGLYLRTAVFGLNDISDRQHNCQ